MQPENISGPLNTHDDYLITTLTCGSIAIKAARKHIRPIEYSRYDDSDYYINMWQHSREDRRTDQDH